MRPVGEIRQALLTAASSLMAQGEKPTLQAMAQFAQVGRDAARRTVDNMRRAGHLVIVDEMEVDYRNKPVAVYAPKPPVGPDEGSGFVDLADVFRTWAH